MMILKELFLPTINGRCTAISSVVLAMDAVKLTLSQRRPSVKL